MKTTVRLAVATILAALASLPPGPDQFRNAVLVAASRPGVAARLLRPSVKDENALSSLRLDRGHCRRGLPAA